MTDSCFGERLTFADVFAGCGGLSLGLTNAGWKGKFAIEKNPDAFGTLSKNLVAGERTEANFDWPDWLPVQASTTGDLLKNHSEHLLNMKGSIDLLAGGPPCQGFSLAGRRSQSDPRNALTEDYIRMVSLLEPRMLLIENVRGFTIPFSKKNESSETLPYSVKVQRSLKKLGYAVYSELMDLSLFGVPQQRKRFILIAIKNGDPAIRRLGGRSPIDLIKESRLMFLESKGLSAASLVSVKDAIGDMETAGSKLVPCDDSPRTGYVKIDYLSAEFRTPYIELMRCGSKIEPNSLRLPRHKEQTKNQFRKIMDTCTPGRNLSDLDRHRLNIKKHSITPLNASKPSATITTLPDDMIHYSEPRILTARENARLQSFPDYYQFNGQYTTGGKDRKNSCPRYTQIGNAVPPLFAEAVGLVLNDLAS